jgi:CPA1 family monovalent cation:H+ antiporter
MSRRAVAFLLTEVGWLREAVKDGSVPEFEQAIERTLAFPRSFRVALFAHRWLRLEAPLARELADRFEVLLAQRLVVRELVGFNGRQLRLLFGAGVAETIEKKLNGRLDRIDQAIAALMLQYPSYARALQFQFLRLTAIRLEDERYRQLLAESIITQEMFNGLLQDLAARRKAAEIRPALDLGLDRGTLVGRVPLFADLDEQRRASISRLLRPEFAFPGEVVVRRGERGDRMYFISSGAVEVRVDGLSSVRLGTGDFFGEIALLMQRPRTADVVALGYCQLLSLSRRDLRALLKSDRMLRKRLYEVARERQRGQEAA